VSESHLVSKYVGAGKARPPLNTLGGTRWAKTKEQAESAVRDLAAEMLSIQAARVRASPAMPFRRTPLAARIREQLSLRGNARPMARHRRQKRHGSPKPMDRLICGDVGYGKTEVAIRAAFKAALAGKQVAVLVPTTVLAQQHFNTSASAWPIIPSALNCFRAFARGASRPAWSRDLAAGSVDIVIGTHRLVQDDIASRTWAWWSLTRSSASACCTRKSSSNCAPWWTS
jgi:transcription-repair coupling factor (superfamily II helicase)